MLAHRAFLYDPQTRRVSTTLKRGNSAVMDENTCNDDMENSGEIYYPSFLFKEIIMMAFVFIIVAIVLAVYFPVGLEDPADPTDNLYIPKPEWYFMAFYQLLKYFPGKLEAIATAIVPTGGILMLLLVPLVDKNPEKKPWKRPIAMISLGVVTFAFILLTIIGLVS